MAKTSTRPHERTATQTIDDSPQAGELSERFWRFTSLAILAVATLLRVYHLTLKPLHHDEGVNGFFLTRLFREGIYQYDPGNYHGPTIYYFGLIFTRVFGLNTTAIRLVTVVFGVATVWLALCLRRYIGTVGALTAATLIAVSPGAVYISRYFIHEMMVVFFTFGIVVAALKYHEGEPPEEGESQTSGLVAVLAGAALVASSFAAVYWPQYFRVELLFVIVSSIVVVQSLLYYDGRRSIYLILGAISAAMLFASKETALVSVIVLGIALTTTTIYFRVSRTEEKARKKRRAGQGRGHAASQSGGWMRQTIERLGGLRHMGLMLLVAFAVFVVVNVLFYSSFFTNAKGVVDSLQTYMIWAKTGKQEHVHPFYQHTWWLSQMEAPILILAVVGAFLAVARPKNRFALFAAQWGFGLLAAYSLVPYKTPWLALNFIIPLALAAGYAVNEFYSWQSSEKGFVVAVLAAALLLAGYQSVKLNFFRYDDPEYVYVYGHTHREFLPLVAEIERLGRKTGMGQEIDIAVHSPDYWPLPWYLRDHPRVGYFSKVSPTTSALVIINTGQEDEFLKTFSERYKRVDAYPLRPGVVLVLYARKDISL